MPTQLFFYVVIILGVWLFDRYREGQARQLQAAQLESALSQARLEALRQPLARPTCVAGNAYSR